MKKENIPFLKPLEKINENQKLPKPLIEKKRRARINKSLSDLRVLISDLLKKELMRTRSKRKSGKVEKADVLELAVQYIKEMKQEKSVQKELAFEQGYAQCQSNVDTYFRKILEQKSEDSIDVKVIRPKCCEKHECDETQCTWGKKLYLHQKDLLKTLDRQWTEHVQSANSKLEQQRFMQYDQEKTNDLNSSQFASGQEESIASNKAFDRTESLNPNNSINERMNTLNLQNLSTSKNQSFSPMPTRKFLSLQWKDKQLTKAEELMQIKLFNETVCHNLNRNSSLCSSASSTSSCSSASSHAKALKSLNYHLNHQLKINHQSNQSLKSSQVMPTDLDRFDSSNNFSSASSYCSVSSLSSIQSSSNKTSEYKNSDKANESVYANQSKYSNSPFKKRKKVYQLAFDSCAGSDVTDLGSSESVWRPW